jgi:hypothetical protein
LAAKRQSKPVPWDEILSAFEFVTMGAEFGNSAYVCRDSGVVHWHSEYGGEFEELPEDIDDPKYVALPDQRDLGLGRALVLSFAAERLPDEYDKVERIFSRKGAYARFKDLLERADALERWREFEAAAKEKALREWCAENGVEVEG